MDISLILPIDSPYDKEVTRKGKGGAARNRTPAHGVAVRRANCYCYTIASTGLK